MPTWVRNNGLLIVNLALFVVFLVGMAIAGVQAYNEEQLIHGENALTFAQYLGSPDFIEAVSENWESEFLQMGMYVVLTAILFQKGSAESKPIDEPAPQDADPAKARNKKDAPTPVRQGGVALVVYEHSLSILFFLLFFASITVHAISGAGKYSEEQMAHGEPGVTPLEYVGTPQFWFESFQNWQSEFLAVAAIVLASVYLRQRGSAESKPVAAPQSETGT